MELLNKKQVNEILGKYGVWSGKTGDAIIGDLKYLGGVTEIDEYLKENKLDIKNLLTILKTRPNGLEVNIGSAFKTTRVGLFTENIKFWTIEQQNEVIAKKSKSVVGRALLGGILLGPVGAIVGGMTGVGDKKIKVSDVDNIMSISYLDNDKEIMLLFSVTNKKVKKVFDFMKKNFGDKFISPSEIKEKSLNSNNENISIADELKKLKELLDAGVLTNDEFQKEKERLLNR